MLRRRLLLKYILFLDKQLPSFFGAPVIYRAVFRYRCHLATLLVKGHQCCSCSHYDPEFTVCCRIMEFPPLAEIVDYPPGVRCPFWIQK